MGGAGSKGFAGDCPRRISVAFEISNHQIVGMDRSGEKAADGNSEVL